MSAGKEAVEQLQLQARALKRDKEVDLRLTDQAVHALGRRVGLDRDMRLARGLTEERRRGIHAGDDAARGGEAGEDVADEVQRGLLVLLDRELGVIKDEVRAAGHGADAVVGVEAGDEGDARGGQQAAQGVGVGGGDGRDEVGRGGVGQVATEAPGLKAVEESAEGMALGLADGAVIIVLDVARAEDFDAARQTWVVDAKTRVQALEEDRRVVLQEALHESFVAAAGHVVRLQREVRKHPRATRVIVHLGADALQLRGARALVFVAVQDEAHAEPVERQELIVDVDDAAVIRGVRDVEGDDVEGIHRG